MKLLRITLDGEEFPNYTFSKAFEKAFDEVETIWWQQHDRGVINHHILDRFNAFNPDVVFMQIQEPNVLLKSTADHMGKKCPVFNWTGDVRVDLSRYTSVGENIITLFTNKTDVDTMRFLGFRSDYLQTGYDTAIYKTKECERSNQIVFCANHYEDNPFPLTRERVDLVFALKRAFNERFNLYGRGWERVGLHADCYADNIGESERYQQDAIAINLSHFNYKQYYSDRLLREMACGIFVLSHRFIDCDLDFTDGVHYVLWDNLDDLIEKCTYYLDNKEERLRIGKNAADYVSRHCNWDARMVEFKNLIEKYKK